MAKKLKKAFTITELVIVIAVIAILAAVLIPTFSNVINRANESADIQAVREMNIALDNAEALNGKPTSVSEAMDILAADNLDARGYRALAKNHAILYHLGENIVVYLNTSTYEIEYPEGLSITYSETTLGNWYNLDGRMEGDNTWQQESENNPVKTSADIASLRADDAVPSAIIKEGDNIIGAKVDTAAKLVAVAEYLETLDNYGEGFTLILGADMDMSNSQWKPISEYRGSFYGNNHTISNLEISDFTAEAKAYSAATPDTSYYYYGFISVFSGSYFGNVKFENIVIDRPGHTANIGTGSSRNNHTVGGAIGGIVVPAEYYGPEHTVTVENVTVSGTIHAYSRGGGIVGYIGGYNGSNDLSQSQMECTVNIRGCTNNSTITTDVQVSNATIGGILGTTNQRKASSEINITTCVNTGNLTGHRTGGIVADVHGSGAEGLGVSTGTINISDCTNSGAITSYGDGAGGIYGYFQLYSYCFDVTITGCQNTGALQNTANSANVGNMFGATSSISENGHKINLNMSGNKTADGAVGATDSDVTNASYNGSILWDTITA